MQAFHSDDNALMRAVQLLCNRELVIFPTETVYGIGALLFDEMSVQRLFEVKGRRQEKALIAHLGCIDDIEKVALPLPDHYLALLEQFMPGPLTLVWKKQPRVPLVVTGGRESIALRIPSHPVAQRLLHLVGAPLVASSANLSGHKTCDSLPTIHATFGNRVAAIIDGGPPPQGIPSTILCLCNGLRILREGAVPREALETALHEKIF